MSTPPVHPFAKPPQQRSKLDPPIEIRIERQKAMIDLFKHLATLAAGSLLLTSGFAEKVFPDPIWKPVLAITLVSFCTCIVATLLSQLVSVINIGHPDGISVPPIEALILHFGMLLAAGGYVVGVISLAAFAIANFMR